MKFFSIATLLASAVSALPLDTSPVARDLETRGACSAANTDRLIFSVSMSYFQAARKPKKQRPACFVWTSDNCSKSPDRPAGFNFIPSCQRHDFGYRNTKKQKRFTKAMKARIDSNFKKDLYNVCKTFHGIWAFRGVQCRRIADVYYNAVKKFGKRDEELVFDKAPIQEREAIAEAVADAIAEAEPFDADSVVFDDAPELDETPEGGEEDLPEVEVE